MADFYNKFYLPQTAIGGTSAESQAGSPLIVAHDDLSYITSGASPIASAAVITGTSGITVLNCSGFLYADVYLVDDATWTLTAGTSYFWGATSPSSGDAHGRRPQDLNTAFNQDGPHNWINLPVLADAGTRTWGAVAYTAEQTWLDEVFSDTDFFLSSPKRVELRGCNRFMVTNSIAYVGASANAVIAVRFTTA